MEITIAIIEVIKEIKMPNNSIQSETVSSERFILILLSEDSDMAVSCNKRIGEKKNKVNVFIRSEGDIKYAYRSKRKRKDIKRFRKGTKTDKRGGEYSVPHTYYFRT